MKYSVTLTLRDVEGPLSNFGPHFNTYYYEATCIHDLNDWLFHHLCNTYDHRYVCGLFLEVLND